MRQSRGLGAAATPSHLSVLCFCHLSVCGVSCLSPLCPWEDCQPGQRSPLPRNFNLPSPPFFLPLTPQVHLSLPFLAFIFIFFFLFFLCAPSRGAVTEEKGPATWE